MFTEITYVQLHTPIFLAGKNFKEKIDTGLKEFKDVSLNYDTDTQRLWIEYKGIAGFLGFEGFVVPKDPLDFGYEKTTTAQTTGPIVTHTPQPMVANVSRTAQVETPMAKPPKAPTLRNKFQGA